MRRPGLIDGMAAVIDGLCAQAALRTVAPRPFRAFWAFRAFRVGVDGVDGAGKTCFADELGAALVSLGRQVVRVGVDSFHNPRAVRYQRGRSSAEGYFLDSFDYDTLRRVLLDPLSPGGSGRYRVAAFDHLTDNPVDTAERAAEPGTILVFDGIFLHRPELARYWDYSVFLRVGFDVSVARCARRDGSSPDPHAGSGSSLDRVGLVRRVGLAGHLVFS